LYCIVLLLCYAQYFILETVESTFVCLYCIVLFVCDVFFFLKSHVITEFVDLQNDMYVCIFFTFVTSFD